MSGFKKEFSSFIAVKSNRDLRGCLSFDSGSGKIHN